MWGSLQMQKVSEIGGKVDPTHLRPHSLALSSVNTAHLHASNYANVLSSKLHVFSNRAGPHAEPWEAL